MSARQRLVRDIAAAWVTVCAEFGLSDPARALTLSPLEGGAGKAPRHVTIAAVRRAWSLRGDRPPTVAEFRRALGLSSVNPKTLSVSVSPSQIKPFAGMIERIAAALAERPGAAAP
jgi:hypothetical protein